MGAMATGCSKEGGEQAPAPPAPSAVAAAVDPIPSASPDPPAPASALAPEPAPTPTPTPAPATATATATGKTAKAAPTCGDKPLPPCPLYAWMKANTSAAMSAQDFDGIATALDKVVTFAPAGYGNWASIARDGAAAARSQSLDAVKASCRSCHNQYKDKYKKEMRDRPI